MESFTDLVKIVTIDSGQPGPCLLISAGVHGDEHEPVLAALALTADLQNIIAAGKVCIVPVVNTSAYKAGSRFGDDGLDLARVCPGNAAGSSTEKDAFYISELIKKADYYIDLHTGGAIFEIFPLTGYMLHDSEDILKTQRNMAMAFQLPVVWGTESAPQGRTVSVARDAGVPAIYVEYGGGGTLNKEVITAYRQGCMLVMESLGMIKKLDTIPFSPTYWVEDHTVNGGYLQGKLPALSEGIFVPEKKIGELVEKDDLLGTIFNPFTKSETLVVAESPGFLFFLRNAAKVNTGDALGGILPITKPGKVIIHGT